MIWLGHEGIRFVQILTDNGQEKYLTSSGLYCKLVREENGSAEEWMGHVRVKANEYEYKQRDRRLNEQLINRSNDDKMIIEVIKELNPNK